MQADEIKKRQQDHYAPHQEEFRQWELIYQLALLNENIKDQGARFREIAFDYFQTLEPNSEAVPTGRENEISIKKGKS